MKTKTPHPIAELRSEYGITQKELAEIMNVSKRAIEQWEGGKRTCSPAMLQLAVISLQNMKIVLD